MGRLLSSAQITDGQTYTSGYLYNLSGALVQETYPSGRVVKNEFESDGDLRRIYGNALNQTEKTYANGFTYTADGKIQRLRLGNGRWESAKFNERLQVTELALGSSNGDGGLWKLNYEYGELNTDGTTVNTTKNTGNIAKQTVSFNGLANPFVQTYKYDALYRLTEARETSGANQTWKQTFGYDRFGNRNVYQKFIGTTPITLDNKSFPQIDATTNRILATQGYVFDKNGNLTNDAENRQFTFNGDNKQTKVELSGNKVGEYFYDGEGKRVKKKVYDSNGVLIEETVFVYSSGKLVAEYTTAPPPSNPTTSYTATDQLGSPRVITNALGQVTSRRDFQPFGEELTPDTVYRKTSDKYGATDSVRQRFTGYQKDTETGLDFAEARMYENRHARFTAVDPLLASGKSANPQTFNRYVYVSNSPLIITDPTGLIGDYYTRSGIYIGTDNNPKTEGKVYFGDIGSKEGEYTYVVNAEETTLFAVQHIQNWYTRSIPGRTPNFLDSYPANPFGEAATGFGKGIGNIGVGLANAASEVAWVHQTGGVTPNPFAIERFSLDTPIERNFGIGTEVAAVFASGVAAAPFRAGSALSVVPEGNAFRATEFFPPIKPGSSGGPSAFGRIGTVVKREAVAENPNGICVFCRQRNATQFDHAFARSRGGNATIENTQRACSFCNQSKGAGQFPKNPAPGYQGQFPPPWWNIIQ